MKYYWHIQRVGNKKTVIFKTKSKYLQVICNMNNQYVFSFKTDTEKISITSKLNNPFGSKIPEIAKIAAEEFQKFITSESKKWKYNFRVRNGKMFGVLVIQKEDKTYGYLGTVSGDMSSATCDKFVPSVFDISVDDYFIDRGMSKLTEMGKLIKASNNPVEIKLLKEKRKQKSIALQQQLFENYWFLNLKGKEKNVLQIFENSSQGKPPSAAGECAAPKLLNYALKHQLKPIALAEFWWGNPLSTTDRKHREFYPACEGKCRPILEYMLDDEKLFNEVKLI